MCCVDIYKKLIYDLCKKITDKASYLDNTRQDKTIQDKTRQYNTKIQ